MFIRFKKAAEVAANPDRPEQTVKFAARDEADLLPGVAEELVRSGAAERAERPTEAPAPAAPPSDPPAVDPPATVSRSRRGPEKSAEEE